MDLETMVPSKNGTKVLVNGVSYEISDTGLLRNVPQAAALKLLQNPSWQIYDGATNKRMPSGHKRAMALIGGDGTHHEAPPLPIGTDPSPGNPPTLDQVVDAGYSPEAAQAIVDRESGTPPSQSEDYAPTGGDAPPPVNDAPPPIEVAPPVPEIAPPAEEESKPMDMDPEIPGEDGEWSDPSTEYSMDWLRACAEAYEVKFPANIGAEKLVAKIKTAMYG